MQETISTTRVSPLVGRQSNLPGFRLRFFTFRGSESWLRVCLWTALICLLLLAALMASVPPVSRDALTHHLAVPKLYLQHGSIFEIPSIEFSYYPMNLDLLYLLPLYFGNDTVPKFIHFAFALSTAGLIFGYLCKRSSRNLAIAGALFFLSLPVIVKLSITVYVDLGLIFFTAWSLLSLLKWRETGFLKRHLVIAAVACGLALGTKYNALPAFFLLTSLVPILYIRNQQQNGAASAKAVMWVACFAVTALLVFSPWMIRNVLWTGNPIYPLYDGFFNPGSAGHSPSLGPFAIRKLVYGEAWWETLLIPLRVFFQGQDDLPQLFDGRLNPLLLILPIFAFFPRRKNGKTHRSPVQGVQATPSGDADSTTWGNASASINNQNKSVTEAFLKQEKLILLGFAVGYLLLTFFTTDMRIRYISPIIPPLVILAVLGFQNLFRAVGGDDDFQSLKSYQTVAIVGVLLLCSLNGIYIFQLFKKVNPIPYISGEVSREGYISQHRPEFPSVDFANRSLPPNARILSIFLGNRRYYFEREVLFDLPLVQRALNSAQNPEDFLNALKEKGITHLVIGLDLFNNWLNGNATIDQTDLLNRFFKKKTQELFMQNNYSLFKLL